MLEGLFISSSQGKGARGAAVLAPLLSGGCRGSGTEVALVWAGSAEGGIMGCASVSWAFARSSGSEQENRPQSGGGVRRLHESNRKL